jgi:hypothetical protein
MKRLSTLMTLAVVVAFTPMADAQLTCPPEVAQAKAMLQKKMTARVPAPGSLAGARGSDAQVGRGQDAQTGRGQDAQTGRGQDAQTGRGQDAQTGRPLAGAKPGSDNVSRASQLVTEAESACKVGDTTTAKAKAQAALELLR